MVGVFIRTDNSRFIFQAIPICEGPYVIEPLSINFVQSCNIEYFIEACPAIFHLASLCYISKLTASTNVPTSFLLMESKWHWMALESKGFQRSEIGKQFLKWYFMDKTHRSCDNLNWNFKEEEITLISVTRFNKGIHKHIFLTISFL